MGIRIRVLLEMQKVVGILGREKCFQNSLYLVKLKFLKFGRDLAW